MERTLLRTMTRKSVFEAGKFEHRSVQQLLDMKMKHFIRYCYFCYSKLTFTEDILEEVGVTEEYRIQKPGVNKDFYESLELVAKQKKDNFIKWEMAHGNFAPLAISKKRGKRRSANRANYDRMTKISKGALMAKNHGK